MNKKAQEGPIAFIFLLFAFIIFWFVWLGKFLVDMGQLAIINGNMTGIEAFFYANLNLWVFIALILGMLGFMWFAGRSS